MIALQSNTGGLKEQQNTEVNNAIYHYMLALAFLTHLIGKDVYRATFELESTADIVISHKLVCMSNTDIDRIKGFDKLLPQFTGVPAAKHIHHIHYANVFMWIVETDSQLQSVLINTI